MLIFAGVLHDLFTVVWIGGLLTMGLVVMPAAKKVFEDPGEAKKFTGMVQKRMSRFGFISIAVLLVTGVVLARSGSDFAGLFSFDNLFSSLLAVKHLIFLVMVIIVVARSLILKKWDSPAVQKNRIPEKLFLANVLLGTTVVIISSIISAIG